MKEILVSLAGYNVWANNIFLGLILKLPSEKIVAEVPSSFKSLQLTCLHMLDAESIWWQRLKLSEHITVPSENFSGDFELLSASLIQQSQKWKEWVTNASDLALDHVFQFHRKKETVKMPVYQMLQHVFNHGTYHRGQLVNICRQLGVEKIPSTDYSTWVRRI